jgi:hypothetical protein
MLHNPRKKRFLHSLQEKISADKRYPADLLSDSALGGEGGGEIPTLNCQEH